MNSPLKAGRAVLLSLVVLVALAAPASAAGPAVLAAAKPWHYWISFVLAASFVGLVVMMVVGYLVRVIMLKYGIKVGRKHT
jgi:thiosulfate reductase cytochrome b subunit